MFRFNQVSIGKLVRLLLPGEDSGLSNTPKCILVIDMGGWKLETIFYNTKIQVAGV